jgi:hypothetical protein
MSPLPSIMRNLISIFAYEIFFLGGCSLVETIIGLKVCVYVCITSVIIWFVKKVQIKAN